MKKIALFSILTNIVLILLLGYYFLRKRNAYKNNIQHKTKIDIYNNLPINKNDIIFFGDSMIEFGRWNEFFNNKNVKNRGISGERIEGFTHRLLNSQFTENPKKIFVMIGVNDILNNIKLEKFTLNFSELVLTLKQTFPNTEDIFICSILPISMERNKKDKNIMHFNNEILKIIKAHHIKYVNLFPLFIDNSHHLKSDYSYDGLHLNGNGYSIWQNAIQKHID